MTKPRTLANPIELRTCVKLRDVATGHGGIRTHTPVTGEGILSPQRLPFRHVAKILFSWHLLTSYYTRHSFATPITTPVMEPACHVRTRQQSHIRSSRCFTTLPGSGPRRSKDGYSTSASIPIQH